MQLDSKYFQMISWSHLRLRPNILHRFIFTQHSILIRLAHMFKLLIILTVVNPERVNARRKDIKRISKGYQLLC